jgi:hypothetical protein
MYGPCFKSNAGVPRVRLILFLLCASLSFVACYAQRVTSTFPTQQAIKKMTDSLATQITRYYVDQEAALKMAAAIRKNFKDGRYRNINDEHVLAGKLTADMRAVHNDEHLHVEFNPLIAYELSGEVEDVPGMVAEKLQKDREQNFGFRKVEILNGNIGYLELSGFSRLNRYSKVAADAALEMLSNSRALIIDLRYGVGGSPEMMTHILSHFYDKRTHVSDVFIRSEKATLSYYTTPDSSYSRLNSMPLYVLTSYKTFSAAEGLVYALQTTGRAKIIGEVTRGGAHTVSYRPLGSGFVCDMPFGMAISPVTKKNWEKTGITPDINVKAEDALETAELCAFAQAISETKDSATIKRLRLQRDLLISENHPLLLDTVALRAFEGSYGPYFVTYNNSCLYYQKTGKAKFPLLPMSPTTMRPKGNDTFMVEFQKDSTGRVNRMITWFDDGRSEYAERGN